MFLPAATERFVERCKLFAGALLRRYLLLLDSIFLPLRIDHVARVDQSALNAWRRNDGSAAIIAMKVPAAHRL